MSTKTLYQFPYTVWLVQVDYGVENRNLSPNASDFKVYKGTYSPLEFIVRNNDRKPVNLVGKFCKFTVYNEMTNEIMIQDRMDMLDDYNGRIRYIVKPNQVADWYNGFYKYTVTIYNGDGTNNILFTDQNQTASGFFELTDGALPPINKPFIIKSDEFTPILQQVFPNVEQFWSGAYPGSSQFGLMNNHHGVAIYTNKWNGKFIVQATLENQPAQQETDWFTLIEKRYPDPISGIRHFQIMGNYQYFKFIYENDIHNQGTFDKVLYKP